MENVVDIKNFLSQSPILKTGDLVKLVDLYEIDETLGDLDGLSGIVTEIETTYGDRSSAPGQAHTLTVAIPDDEEWVEIENVSIENVHRVIGPNSFEVRGWHQG